MTYLKSLVLPFVCASVVVLSGCAKPACHQNMVISNADIPVYTSAAKTSKFKNHIAVQSVTGGSETNPLWLSKVNSKEFKQALEKSLDNLRLYDTHPETAPYRLEASLNKLKQPLAGFNLTVTCDATYRIIDNKTNTLVYEKTLKTPYTEKFMSALLYAERLKLANEGAVKENIKELINDLYHSKESKLGSS